MARYAVLDFETNGLMPDQGGRALEVAAVLLQDGQIVDSWQSLMNPGVRVPGFITSLTGITPTMIRTAPAAERVMAEIAEFVGDATLVDLHNNPIDGRHHRALADASMTAHLFLRMQADLAALYQGAETRPDFLSTYQKTVKTQLKFVPESARARG